MGLTLTVLGASAAWSQTPCRPSSSYLIEHADAALILDLGQGSLGSLFAHRDPSSVTAIAISHMHADHHVDLVPLRNLLRFGYDEPRRVGLHVPHELRRRYDAFLGEDDFLADLAGPELTAGTFTVGPFEVRAQPVTHSLHSFGFRVSLAGSPDGPGLVYSGDCGVADDLLPLIREGDTLLCEAFWSTREPIADAMHLDAHEAARIASEARAGSLLLTHVLDAHDPAAAVDAARRTFAGPVELATPELRVAIDDGSEARG